MNVYALISTYDVVFSRVYDIIASGDRCASFLGEINTYTSVDKCTRCCHCVPDDTYYNNVFYYSIKTRDDRSRHVSDVKIDLQRVF